MKGMEGRPTLIKPQGDRGERLGQRLVAPRTAGAAPGRPQLGARHQCSEYAGARRGSCAGSAPGPRAAAIARRGENQEAVTFTLPWDHQKVPAAGKPVRSMANLLGLSGPDEETFHRDCKCTGWRLQGRIAGPRRGRMGRVRGVEGEGRRWIRPEHWC
jgi:hypothetical protein